MLLSHITLLKTLFMNYNVIITYYDIKNSVYEL